jgi:hypothetical protein
MKTLNLQRIHEICEILSEKQDKLAEESKYVYLLGNSSKYVNMSFEGFLEYYYFKVEDDTVMVLNNDRFPYEDYTNGDFSYIPTVLLTFDDSQLNEWAEDKIKGELEQQKIQKAREKESLKLQIERLQTQLDSL